MSLSAKKEELRKQMKSFISPLSPQQRAEKSRKIVEQLCKFLAQNPGGTLAVFVPLASEPDIRKCIDRAEMNGRSIAFPHSSKTTYTFVSLDTSDAKGIGCIDVMLVPGVAFTPEGKRLGRGGGWYDRVLARHRTKNPELISIGICFDEQLVDNIPICAYDQIMDKMVYA